jgi:hypothetical protein
MQSGTKKRLEGPSIVFESRISELEAQLTQTKMDLRKALEEADLYKKKLADQPLSFETHTSFSASDCDSHRQQIEKLQKLVERRIYLFICFIFSPLHHSCFNHPTLIMDFMWSFLFWVGGCIPTDRLSLYFDKQLPTYTT